MRHPRGRLVAAGIGLDPLGDLPLAGLQAILSAGALLSIEWPGSYRQFIARAGFVVEDLQPMFDRYPLRHDALRAAAELAAARAAIQDGVVFLIGGHPTFASILSTFLREETQRAGVQLSFIPAISSLDRALADLGYDPADEGLQVVRGTALNRLSSAMPVALLCPGYAVDIGRVNRLRELARLVASLREIYGSDSLFLTYSRSSDRAHVVARPLDALIADLGTRAYLGDVLLLGPVAMLPAHVARQAA